MPMYWDPEALLAGKAKVIYNREMPGRIGVIGRRAEGNTIRWFETDPFYMYHTINAYEEGDEIVLVGCRIEDPVPRSRDEQSDLPRLTYLQLDPYLCTWRLNLKTGLTKYDVQDDVPSEFPRTNDTTLGMRQRYSYNPRIARQPQLLFDGVIKYDLEQNNSQTFAYGDQRWGGETVFAPKPGATAEDEGYVLTWLYDDSDDHAEVLGAGRAGCGAGANRAGDACRGVCQLGITRRGWTRRSWLGDRRGIAPRPSSQAR